MGRQAAPRVNTGWRVIAPVLRRDALQPDDKTLQHISRVFHSKQAAQDFADLARAGPYPDAYIAEVVKPERKVPDIA